MKVCILKMHYVVLHPTKVSCLFEYLQFPTDLACYIRWLVFIAVTTEVHMVLHYHDNEPTVLVWTFETNVYHI
jgi:hypothetical protein